MNPAPGELWMDDDGCFYTIGRESAFFAFGVYDPVNESPLLTLPMRRVMLVDGTWVGPENVYNPSPTWLEQAEEYP